MQTLVLATGERPGLEAIAGAAPRPMLPVANTPVMARMLEALARLGVTQAHVCLLDRPGAIEGFFGDGMRWGMRLTYVPLREPLGSAGAVRRAFPQLQETLLVAPADALIDLDLAQALAVHRDSNAVLTVIKALTATGTAEPTGAFLLEPAALDQIPATHSADLWHDVAPALQHAGMTVSETIITGYWNPLATMNDYHAAQRDLLLSAAQAANDAADPARPSFRYASIRGRQVARGIWVARGDAIHPTARLAAPVCIGENCRIGAGAEIGPFAVIGDGCIIGDEATVRDSTIIEQTYVGQLVETSGRVVYAGTLVDPASGERAEVVDAFLLGPARPLYQHTGIGWTNRALALLLLLLLSPVLLPLAILAIVSSGRVLDRAPSLIGITPGGPRTAALLRFATASNGMAARWIRQSGFWHLPALWNVVRGELALVGIKPLPPDAADRLGEEWQTRRYDRPAGLTGLWYVQAPPGADLLETTVADVYYTATHSWFADLAILARTPGAWLRRRFRSATPAVSLERQTLR